MSQYSALLGISSRYQGNLNTKYLYIEEDNSVIVSRLKEVVFNGTFLDGATGQITLFNTSGTTLAGTTFPISMTAVTSAPGRYEGTVEAEKLTLTKGQEVDMKITITSSGSQVARWLRRLIVVDRTN